MTSLTRIAPKDTNALAAQIVREATAYGADKLPRRLNVLPMGDAAEYGFAADLCGDVEYGVKFDGPLMYDDLRDALDDAADDLALSALDTEVGGFSTKELTTSVGGIRIAPAGNCFIVCFTVSIECDLVRD
jgi:hypothetical protein